MRLPWTKRNEQAQNVTAKAKAEYEWAVQNRTTVRDVVGKLVYHATEKNQIIENLNLVAKGGHK